MLYATPPSTAKVQESLDELDQLRRELGLEVSRPVPWMGSLRRFVKAIAVESSTSIEGFHVPRDEVVAIVGAEESPDVEDADRMAVACYSRAMDHVGVLAGDPSFRWLDRVILDLHFDACYFQRDTSPGLWRAGPIGVAGNDGRVIYDAPDADGVATLMAEAVD